MLEPAAHGEAKTESADRVTTHVTPTPAPRSSLSSTWGGSAGRRGVRRGNASAGHVSVTKGSFPGNLSQKHVRRPHTSLGLAGGGGGEAATACTVMAAAGHASGAGGDGMPLSTAKTEGKTELVGGRGKGRTQVPSVSPSPVISGEAREPANGGTKVFSDGTFLTTGDFAGEASRGDVRAAGNVSPYAWLEEYMLYMYSSLYVCIYTYTYSHTHSNIHIALYSEKRQTQELDGVSAPDLRQGWVGDGVGGGDGDPDKAGAEEGPAAAKEKEEAKKGAAGHHMKDVAAKVQLMPHA